MITRARWLALAACVVLTSLCAPTVSGAREYLQLFVSGPYLELHTGPGRGFPVFHVVPRDGSVDVLFRRTDWFKVRTDHGVEGWVSAADMQKTILADGSPFQLNLGDLAGFTSHRYEMGMFAGAYGGASLVSAYGSRSFNRQLAVELALGAYYGRYSNGYTADIGLAHVFMPESRWSPFLTLGGGVVHTEPKATLVQPSNHTDPSAYVGGGIRYYLTRRLFLRAEYKAHWVFATGTKNEEVDEWKAGFAFFF